jgi:pantetheine-phosphate adenylyltransferase
MERLAIYPGSFDPVTNGHIDIIERGLGIFDKIIVVILLNPSKQFLFTLEERLDMLKECFQDNPRVTMDSYNGLTVNFAKQKNAHAILRGMRGLSDFEYEFQLALMNRRLERDIQSVFLMTGFRWFFTSSSIIKEAARFNGDISGMVPEFVEKRLKEKFQLINP